VHPEGVPPPSPPQVRCSGNRSRSASPKQVPCQDSVEQGLYRSPPWNAIDARAQRLIGNEAVGGVSRGRIHLDGLRYRSLGYAAEQSKEHSANTALALFDLIQSHSMFAFGFRPPAMRLLWCVGGDRLRCMWIVD